MLNSRRERGPEPFGIRGNPVSVHRLRVPMDPCRRHNFDTELLHADNTDPRDPVAVWVPAPGHGARRCGLPVAPTDGQPSGGWPHG